MKEFLNEHWKNPPQLFIPILLGTARKERQSEKVAQFVVEETQKFGFKTQLVDVKEYALARTIPPWQENLKGEQWKKIVKKADGLIIVVPEYNHSYPGELKIMLDQLFDEYARKPVGLCAVSSGNFGGVRVVELMQPLITTFKMVSVPSTVYFSGVEEVFNKQGVPKDAFYEKRLNALLRDMQWYAKTLKFGREHF